MPVEAAKSPSIWHSAHDVDPSALAPVLAALHQKGIRTEPAETLPGSGCGIVFFSQFSPSLLSLIEQLLGRQRMLLCVAVGDERPASTAVWQLLSAGARDVIVGSGQSGVEQIAARLKRWHEVECLLESDAVAQTLVGVSPAWRDLLRQVVEVARFTDIPVLIIGETGTGKELIAKLIHDLDARPNRREMVTADCTTIVPSYRAANCSGTSAERSPAPSARGRRVRTGASRDFVSG
jgi:hypothetical protein